LSFSRATPIDGAAYISTAARVGVKSDAPHNNKQALEYILHVLYDFELKHPAEMIDVPGLFLPLGYAVLGLQSVLLAGLTWRRSDTKDKLDMLLAMVLKHSSMDEAEITNPHKYSLYVNKPTSGSLPIVRCNNVLSLSMQEGLLTIQHQGDPLKPIAVYDEQALAQRVKRILDKDMPLGAAAAAAVAGPARGPVAEPSPAEQSADAAASVRNNHIEHFCLYWSC
jgi:hypothetical protein